MENKFEEKGVTHSATKSRIIRRSRRVLINLSWMTQDLIHSALRRFFYKLLVVSGTHTVVYPLCLWTRDGTAEPVSRDQILRACERGQEKKHYPVQLTTGGTGNHTRLMHQISYDHSYTRGSCAVK